MYLNENITKICYCGDETRCRKVWFISYDFCWGKYCYGYICGVLLTVIISKEGNCFSRNNEGREGDIFAAPYQNEFVRHS